MIVIGVVIVALLVAAFVFAWRVDRRAKRNGDSTRSAGDMTRAAYGSRTGTAADNSVRSPSGRSGGSPFSGGPFSGTGL